jgi:hypothetical protein
VSRGNVFPDALISHVFQWELPDPMLTRRHFIITSAALFSAPLAGDRRRAGRGVLRIRRSGDAP